MNLDQLELPTHIFTGSDIWIEGPEAPRATVRMKRLVDLPVNARRPFEWNGRPYLALGLEEAQSGAARAQGLSRLPIRQGLALWSDEELRPALKALALLNWLATSRFCGACGAALAAEPPGPAAAAFTGPAAAKRDPAKGNPAKGAAALDPDSSALTCPACGHAHFPRISPAVIVLVRKEGKALLARNARFPPGGRFGLLAGFVEAGETLEEAAAREVLEESGLRIEALRYVSSQPWPFPDSLMLAFTAEWAGGEARPDGREIAELRWCGPDEMPDIPPRGSVARRLIDEFCLGNS